MNPFATDHSDAIAREGRLSAGAQRGLRLALYANGGALLVYALQAVLGIGGEGVGRFFEYWFCALFFLSAAICLARGMLVRSERLLWSLLAFSLAVFGLGWVEFVFVTQQLDSPPYPSLADILWIAFYPGCFLALVLLLRRRVGSLSMPLLLDAALAALATAALVAALAFEPLRAATGGSGAAVATNLVCPLTDLYMLVFLLFLVLLTRGRRWRPAPLLLIGFAAAAVCDTVFAYEAASGGYEAGGVLDSGWALMAFALAHAAAQRPRRLRAVRLEGWAALWLPGFFGLIAVSLLIYGNLAELSLPALVLASATLIAAAVRALGLFKEGLTERERGVEALRQARAELETRVAERTAELAALSHQNESILNSAGEGIYGIDCDGETIFVNSAAAAMTGYSVEDFVSAPDADALLHHTRPDGSPYPREECPVQQTLRSGTAQEVSGELYFRKDGTSFPVEYTSTPIRENGHMKGAVVVFRDVTEREATERERTELERRLAQSQRLESVGQLAGGIAHDFNNLLAVILNYASFVREDLPADDAIRDDVEEIERAAERASALTRQLLVFSRREPIEPEVLGLNMVVADMEKLLRRTIGEDIELRTQLAEGLPMVKADRSQIDQVLLNLAVNARDAMPEGGALTIETHAAAASGAAIDATRGSVSLTVTDTGCGMAEDVAARAFEPFFSTKAKDLGSGLGLATVYGIVAQAGGEIELASAPGRGTVVEVRLPATDETAAPAPAPLHAPAQPAASTEVILLVEDEHAVREATRRILSRHGHTVVSAASAAEALEVFAELAPSVALLVTDVVMPAMSGKELAERMRESHPSLRVLYISGYTDDIVSRHGVLEPGIPFLQKPFDVHALLARVREALAAPQAHRRAAPERDDESHDLR